MLLALLPSEGRRGKLGALGGMLQAPEGPELSFLIDLLLAVLFSRLMGVFNLFFSFSPHLTFGFSFCQWILKIYSQYARPHPKGSAKWELTINIYFRAPEKKVLTLFLLLGAKQ